MSPPATLYLAVGLGGLLGSVTRALVSLGLLALLGSGFPWGTLAVNGVGSFLIGLYATLTGTGGCIRTPTARREFVLSGFCGGFTTFSFFSLELVLMVTQGDPRLAGTYLAASLALWGVAVVLGWRLGLRLNRLRAP